MGAPCRHTCPKINLVIKGINNAVSFCQQGRETDGEDLKNEIFSEIVNELYELEGLLEDLRENNDALRNWGHESEDKIKELNEEIVHLEDKIIELT